MRKIGFGVAMAALSAILLAPGSGSAQDTCDPRACRVSGGGALEVSDMFGGRAERRVSGDASGVWRFRTPDGDLVEGQLNDVRCHFDGGGPSSRRGTDPNIADFSGPATWNGEEGYQLFVHTEDRGEPTDRDFVTYAVVDGAGNYVVLSGGFVVRGNVQILCGARF